MPTVRIFHGEEGGWLNWWWVSVRERAALASLAPLVAGPNPNPPARGLALVGIERLAPFRFLPPTIILPFEFVACATIIVNPPLVVLCIPYTLILPFPLPFSLLLS